MKQVYEYIPENIRSYDIGYDIFEKAEKIRAGADWQDYQQFFHGVDHVKINVKTERVTYIPITKGKNMIADTERGRVS